MTKLIFVVLGFSEHSSADKCHESFSSSSIQKIFCVYKHFQGWHKKYPGCLASQVWFGLARVSPCEAVMCGPLGGGNKWSRSWVDAASARSATQIKLYLHLNSSPSYLNTRALWSCLLGKWQILKQQSLSASGAIFFLCPVDIFNQCVPFRFFCFYCIMHLIQQKQEFHLTYL